MRVDLIVRDIKVAVETIIRGLDNRLTASENFAPEGDAGQVLTSNGSRMPPSYQDSGAAITFPNNPSQFLNGSGVWVVPPTSSAGGLTHPQVMSRVSLRL